MSTGASTVAFLVSTTVDSEAAAAGLAQTLVSERLAACVHVSAPLASTYWWQGRVESAREWALACKTTEERLPALMARLRRLHPYQVPEIVAVPIEVADPDYLAWVRENTAPAALP